ncbi:outer membrane protein assembly factor BamD [Caulobacter sp. UNC279MFTsu5.1]|nr:outer membrane protein assembly factor BamD [Caulobacter sp. UNC279MFTsu5.1]
MVATAVLVALSVSACAGKRKKPTLAYEERPVELLYSTGANRLDRGSWNEAVDYFREVERQHPYSEWSRRSILMTGYAHYMGNQYNEAISDADRFIGLYPGNPSASYAYYLKAVCYFEQIVDVNRDQAATEQAMAALRDVVQRYPNSEYAQDARLKIDMVSDQLAGKEMTIGRYYLKNGQTLAAIGRFRTVVDRHQTTSHTPEALYRLVESYLTLGLLDEAKRNGAVLGYNFPGDPWYAEAYKLLTANNLKPAVEPLKAGNKKNFLDRLTHDKDKTLAPPAAATPADGAPTTAGETKPAAPAKPKKGGIMGVLGM